MKEAARIANAHHFISSLPHGYDTHVGMRGVDLTPGQKQRIAIARVVLKNAPILLLDEASSAIESESSRVVQEALDTLIMGNKTTILIAHRVAMMRHVDNIVVLNSGKIVEQGTHDSLVQMNGLYVRLMQPHFNKGLRHNRRSQADAMNVPWSFTETVVYWKLHLIVSVGNGGEELFLDELVALKNDKDCANCEKEVD
ncbi:uncharacterized protein A4U43_C05F3730 [Asparagus officinalis]|uniref:ABC transporter domain-containing protein n=1 Tax=Asparagus officinalis TaxID=4686 RepID=A0A5P1EQ56_ASPOF|nr:uncharacterized protein A4U43_C05F3730 [Asparagus officinalis]